MAGAGQAHRPQDTFATTSTPVTNGWLEFRGNDYIAIGRTEQYSTAAGHTFTFDTNDAHRVHVGISTTRPGVWWDIDLAAPGEADLAAGTYIDATNNQVGTVYPEFDMGGSGRGCGQMRSEFRVNQVSITDHVVQAIDVSFIHHCENFMGFAEGRLVVNFATPPTLPVRQAAFAMQGGDDISHSSYKFVNNPDSTLVLGVSERNGNSLFVNVLSNTSSDGQWYVAVAAPAGQALTVGTYDSADKTGSPGHPRLSLSHVWYGGCSTELGSFTINQLHAAANAFGATGTVTPATPALRSRAQATVTGTVMCNGANSVTVKVVLTQNLNGHSVSGMDLQTIPCTSGVAKPWMATVRSGMGAQFQPGPVNVLVTTTAHFAPWPDTTTIISGSTTLSLIPRVPTPPVPRRF